MDWLGGLFQSLLKPVQGAGSLVAQILGGGGSLKVDPKGVAVNFEQGAPGTQGGQAQGKTPWWQDPGFYAGLGGIGAALAGPDSWQGRLGGLGMALNQGTVMGNIEEQRRQQERALLGGLLSGQLGMGMGMGAPAAGGAAGGSIAPSPPGGYGRPFLEALPLESWPRPL